MPEEAEYLGFFLLLILTAELALTNRLGIKK
jgi:hypothetical protein